jgi:hypothetical protein
MASSGRSLKNKCNAELESGVVSGSHATYAVNIDHRIGTLSIVRTVSIKQVRIYFNKLILRRFEYRSILSP